MHLSPTLLATMLARRGSPEELLRRLLGTCLEHWPPEELAPADDLQGLDLAALHDLAHKVLAAGPPAPRKDDRRERASSVSSLLDLAAGREPDAVLRLVRVSEAHLPAEPKTALRAARLALLCASVLPSSDPGIYHDSQALARLTLAQVHRLLGDSAAARSEIHLARKHAKVSSDPHLLAYGHATAAAIGVYDHRPDRALREFHRVRALHDFERPSVALPRSLLLCGFVLLHLDRPAEAAAHLERGASLLDPSGDRHLLVSATSTRCHLLLDLRQPLDARRLYETSSDLYSDPATHHHRDWLVGRLERHVPDLEASARLLVAARDRVAALEDDFSIALLDLELALTYLLAGDHSLAETVARRAYPHLLSRKLPRASVVVLFDLHAGLESASERLAPEPLELLLRRLRYAGPRLASLDHGGSLPA
jgi:hypothetical protein